MNLLKNKILDNEDERYCEIYKIICTVNNKIYIGQAVSHILNHKKYRPYGMEGRFKSHISEAYSNKKNQCSYLNNAIKKYNEKNFVLELLEECLISEANDKEIYYIQQYNSLYPNGYNLTTGGKQIIFSENDRKKTSNGVTEYYKLQKNKKIEEFAKSLKTLENNFNKYIHPLNRKIDNEKVQYGWYLLFESKYKVDFGGIHISLEDSKIMCLDFFNKLYKLYEEKYKNNN